MRAHRLPALFLAAGLALLALSMGGCQPAAPTGWQNAPTATSLVLPTAPPSATPPPTPIATATPTVPISRLPTATPPPIPVYTYRVVAVYPHDPTAFTQGLVYADGVLYESTGLYGQSSLRRVALKNGAVEQALAVGPDFFAEGLALLDGRLYQLTWQSHVGFIYARESLARLGEFSYPTEGWGLTTDGTRLIMSDGTDTLYFLDAQTLSKTHQIEVRANGAPVTRLNELEWVESEVWANIWQTDFLARIDPHSGEVVGWVDLSGLLSAQERAQTDVLNGIAYDAGEGRLFVTGKLWPYLFQIELLPPAASGTLAP